MSTYWTYVEELNRIFLSLSLPLVDCDVHRLILFVILCADRYRFRYNTDSIDCFWSLSTIQLQFTYEVRLCMSFFCVFLLCERFRGRFALIVIANVTANATATLRRNDRFSLTFDNFHRWREHKRINNRKWKKKEDKNARKNREHL